MSSIKYYVKYLSLSSKSINIMFEIVAIDVFLLGACNNVDCVCL